MPVEKTALKTFEVLPLFPTFVWKKQLLPQASGPLNRSILASLATCMPKLDVGQAWQSNHNLHKQPGLERLASSIHENATEVLEFLKIGYRELEITACWATTNAPGRDHRVHCHPNSFLSGVYYVQTQEGANTVNFHDPRSQVAVIRPPVSELTAANADQAVIRVSDGTLLFFPSWLQHSVDVNLSKRNRISVSFNLMFSAYAERLCGPLWGPD